MGEKSFWSLLRAVSVAGGTELAERLRQSICGVPIDVSGRTIVVTMSFGVAATCEIKQVNKLLNMADEALYQAKKAGRNRVEVNS